MRKKVLVFGGRECLVKNGALFFKRSVWSNKPITRRGGCFKQKCVWIAKTQARIWNIASSCDRLILLRTAWKTTQQSWPSIPLPPNTRTFFLILCDIFRSEKFIETALMWFTPRDMYSWASAIKSVLVDEMAHGKVSYSCRQSLFYVRLADSGAWTSLDVMLFKKWREFVAAYLGIRNDNGVHHECVPRVAGICGNWRYSP